MQADNLTGGLIKLLLNLQLMFASKQTAYWSFDHHNLFEGGNRHDASLDNILSENTSPGG